MMMKRKQTGGPPRRFPARLCALALAAAMLLTGAYAGGAIAPTQADAAQAPQPRAPETIETVDTRATGVHLNLFDYNTKSVNQLYSGFQFNDGTGRDIWNQWTGNGKNPGYGKGGVYQGILEQRLSGNKFPVFDAAKVNGDKTARSLNKLFDPSVTAGNTNAVPHTIADANHLFYNEDGYYAYDSTEHYAYYDTRQTETRNFTVYEGARPTDNQTGVGQFLPFNQWNDWRSPNYHFGMTVDFKFLQPKDGRVTDPAGGQQDMVFEFTGDDDVWLFIDGYLVLDMGGIHNAIGGKINFSTGEVTIDEVYTSKNAEPKKYSGTLYELIEDAGADTAYLEANFENKNGKQVFKDYTTHTFHYYYLERGKGGSNCKIKFNLQSIPDDTIYVGKQITETNIPDFSDAAFEFLVEVQGQTQDGQPDGTYLPYQGDYTIYRGTPGGTPEGDGITRTTADGTFRLRHNEYAELKAGIKATSMYRVTELGAYSDQYEITSLDTVTEVYDDDGNLIGHQVQDLVVGKTPTVMFQNAVIAANAHSLDIKKEMTEGQTCGDLFEVQITLGGQLYQNAPFYRLSPDWSADEAQQTDENGCLSMLPGETIRIMQVPWGTSFQIEEVNLSGQYGAPSYRIEGAAEGTEETDEGFAGGSIPVAITESKKTTVTITNTFQTGGFTIKKVKKGTETGLSGAQFELWPAAVTGEGQEQVWEKDDSAQPYTPGYTNGSDSTQADGIASFPNIPFGTYLLYETKAPAGYKLPTAPVRVTIAANQVTLVINGEEVTVPTPTGEGETMADVTIPNKQKDDLPIAGGAGTLWFTCGGLALIGAAALLYGKQRRSKGGTK